MTILVFYTVRHAPVALTPVAAAVAAGLIVTAGLHLWRRNAIVSVLGGTAVHVALASTLPARNDSCQDARESVVLASNPESG
ncbi:AzlD domain-containing protein [Pseudarthrobacter sp. Y6]|uniref:AzlD domain-containing protein n=1 Tax=Pseudarthrobacter sp. Y6 TaxID=3418422 RepID=UPI003CEC6FC3